AEGRRFESCRARHCPAVPVYCFSSEKCVLGLNRQTKMTVTSDKRFGHQELAALDTAAQGTLPPRVNRHPSLLDRDPGPLSKTKHVQARRMNAADQGLFVDHRKLLEPAMPQHG